MHIPQTQTMKSLLISSFLLLLLLLLIFSLSCSSSPLTNSFLGCLSQESLSHHQSTISNHVYTPQNSSYTSILQSSNQNSRYATESTPKPLMIITPEHESQVPPLVHCAKRIGLEIRTLSGGHDLEGLSYVSRLPFVIVDLINLSEITVDAVEKTAWVGAGATLGSLYYRIAEKSPVLGFSAGVCPNVGVGGHLSGGGYGTLIRKYGLAADQVIDARIIDVNGKILDRKSMGEDLFWSIRGGGGASFGIIVAWKVQLVDVTEKVTVFTVTRTLEQNATHLVHRWQYVAPELDKDLFIGTFFRRVNSTIQTTFWSLFLGGVDVLLPLLQERFPELGVVREDCSEMSWIQSIIYFSEFPAMAPPKLYVEKPAKVLLKRIPNIATSFKVKSDYVKEPIPEHGFVVIVRLLNELESDGTIVYTIPYGGRMAEIPESATPFPHRAGNLFKLASLVSWGDDEARNSDKYISWSRRYYSSMTLYVSNSPREAYLNYRDLDLGVNDVYGDTSIDQASVWGKKYFKDNFDRLVYVKTKVDPNNFFKNEQSIPPLHFSCNENGI